MKTFGIILSAGSSTRFGGTIKKQFYELAGKPVLYYSLSTFNNSKFIDEIVLVTSKEDLKQVGSFVKDNKFNKVKEIVVGGETRQESVKNGLDKINEDGYVLIHDAARPLVDEEIISNLVSALKDNDASAPAIKLVDTIIRMNNDELVNFENRDELFAIQTPQAFHINKIKKAHEQFLGKNATDDLNLIKSLGGKIKIIPGKNSLQKITKLEDTNVVEAYIKKNEYLQD